MSQYIVVSRNASTNRNIIVGVLAQHNSEGSSAATFVDGTRALVIEALRQNTSTTSLRDAIADGNYAVPAVFDDRKTARAEADRLNKPEPELTSFFRWGVVQLGEKTKRDLRKVEHWELEALNHADGKPDGEWIKLSHHRKSSRKAARQLARDKTASSKTHWGVGNHLQYRAVPVYA